MTGNCEGNGNGLPARVRRLGRGGRPRSLTDEVQARIVEMLAAGNYLTMACTAAGITIRTYHHWRRRWLDNDPDALPYGEFFLAEKGRSRSPRRTSWRRSDVAAPTGNHVHF
jgi:hypothetical protein